MKAGKDYIGVGVGAIIFNEEDEILLLHREKAPEAGCWSIPGGKVELFENIEDAIKREVKEELGIDIEIVELVGVTNHIVEDEGMHWIAPTFLTKIVGGQVKNMEPKKHGAIKWFSVENLPENITITTERGLEFLGMKNMV